MPAKLTSAELKERGLYDPNAVSICFGSAPVKESTGCPSLVQDRCARRRCSPTAAAAAAVLTAPLQLHEEIRGGRRADDVHLRQVQPEGRALGRRR